MLRVVNWLLGIFFTMRITNFCFAGMQRCEGEVPGGKSLLKYTNRLEQQLCCRIFSVSRRRILKQNKVGGSQALTTSPCAKNIRNQDGKN